jgi:hypothetical protein
MLDEISLIHFSGIYPFRNLIVFDYVRVLMETWTPVSVTLTETLERRLGPTETTHDNNSLQ